MLVIELIYLCFAVGLICIASFICFCGIIIIREDKIEGLFLCGISTIVILLSILILSILLFTDEVKIEINIITNWLNSEV